MKLYGKPGACSLAVTIALQEAGLDFEYIKVDLAAKQLEDGSDYLVINDKGQVPALALDDGTVLTEGAAILQYIADTAPAAELLPAVGTLARYEALAWLNFAATELHKGFAPFFKPNTPDAYKPIAEENLRQKLAYLNEHLASKEFLLGSQFTVADIYTFVVLNWAKFVDIELAKYEQLPALLQRVAARPAVAAALKLEGLS